MARRRDGLPAQATAISSGRDFEDTDGFDVNIRRYRSGFSRACRSMHTRAVPASVHYRSVASLLYAEAPPLVVPPGVQEQRLIRRVRPVYPELARQARIQGTVRLAALIGEDGIVDRLKLISGHPLLVEAAIDAVAKGVTARPCAMDFRQLS